MTALTPDLRLEKGAMLVVSSKFEVLQLPFAFPNPLKMLSDIELRFDRYHKKEPSLALDEAVWAKMGNRTDW